MMLQTGMRAPMGIKVYGPDLKTIEDFGMKLETNPSEDAFAVWKKRRFLLTELSASLIFT
ncbi:MAG: hypothetical protein U5L09_03410 [Bacteroidales bacterium]|nr:hypothetical protein [Bacteroidales bacterium]